MNQRLHRSDDQNYLAFMFLAAALIALMFAAMMTQRSYAGCEYAIVRVDDGDIREGQPPVDKWGDATSPRDSMSPTSGDSIVTFEGYVNTEDGQPCSP